MRFESGEPDKVFGKIEDADGLTHVEHESLTSVFHGCSLQNKIDRFRNGHEKTIHVGMRDSDRPAVRNLPFEDGDNAAATAEHISKADDGKCAFVAVGGVENDH